MPYDILIEGDLTEIQQISARIFDTSDNSTYAPPSASYRWYRDGVAIAGSTGASSTLTWEDAGAHVTVEAEFLDALEVPHLVSTAPDEQQAFEVVFSGVAGGNSIAVLYLAADVADGQAVMEFEYLASGWARYDTVAMREWLAAGLDYYGVAAKILSLVPEDLNPTMVDPSRLYSEFAALFPRGSMVELFDRVANVNNPAEGGPGISGIAREGGALGMVFTGISDPDGINHAGNFQYQWLRDGLEINGATRATYVPLEGDVGSRISLRLTFTDDFGGLETLVSQETAIVEIGVRLTRAASFTMPENGYTLDLQLIGTDNIDGTGNSLNNRITGNAGANVLNGMGGNDTLYGGTGNDYVSGGSGHDRVYGQGGRDTLSGGTGHDVVMSSVGSGADVLLGGSGNDVLMAAGTSDTLNGGAGNDTLYGISGEDVFLFKGRFGTDIIADFRAGLDTIDLSGRGLRFSDLKIGHEGDYTTITLKSGQILLYNFNYTKVRADMFDFD